MGTRLMRTSGFSCRESSGAWGPRTVTCGCRCEETALSAGYRMALGTRGRSLLPLHAAESWKEPTLGSVFKVELTGARDGSTPDLACVFYHLLWQPPLTPVTAQHSCQDFLIFFFKEWVGKSQQSINSSIQSPANVSISQPPSITASQS